MLTEEVFPGVLEEPGHWKQEESEENVYSPLVGVSVAG